MPFRPKPPRRSRFAPTVYRPERLTDFTLLFYSNSVSLELKTGAADWAADWTNDTFVTSRRNCLTTACPGQ
jgi:hypothetical protein